MKGTLYGVGVGPGDPTFMTLQAKQTIETVDKVFIPVTKLGEKSKAFEIVKQVVDVPSENVVEVVFAMKRSKEEQKIGWEEAAKQICLALDKGEHVALVTIGDVSIYSTAFYVCEIVKQRGYEAKMVTGIPSFCAGASLAGISLVEGSESLLVIPSLKGMEQIEQMLPFCDTLVIMKAGKYMEEIECLIEKESNMSAYVLSNIGLEEEYIGELDCSRNYGYLTTVIIKKQS